MTRLSKLDELVRSSLLTYPSLFGTRWDVLQHLYLAIGNGFEWRGGELIMRVPDRRWAWTEEQARVRFFDDFEELRRTSRRFGVDGLASDPVSPLEWARREFQLFHLEELVFEPRVSAQRPFNAGHVLAVMSLDSSLVFSVPADVESSFRAGAVEVLREVVAGLSLLARTAPAVAEIRAEAARLLEDLVDPTGENLRRACLLLDELRNDPRG